MNAATAVIDNHPPFKSVGLVCTCGKSVTGFEGVVACECGAVYTVSVLVLRPAPLALPGVP